MTKLSDMTPDQFRDTVDDLARTHCELVSAAADLDAEIIALREQHAERIEHLRERLKGLQKTASNYARKYPARVLDPGTKSGKTQLAEYGLRESAELRKLNSDWDTSKTIDALLANNLEYCVRTEFKLDKEAAEKLTPGELALVGLRTATKQSFWFRPRTAAHNRAVK